MWLLGKPLAGITKEDILRLIENKVAEGLTHDYKRDLPDFDSEKKKNENKVKFLADISAFANNIGGCLLFGIEGEVKDGKSTGRPKGITGIGQSNHEDILSRMQNICRDSLRPPINNLHFQFIDIDDKRILMVGVPRSLLAPHMICMDKSRAFYTRHDGGNHPMDVHELRKAFLEADEWVQEAEEFRSCRLATLRSDEVLVDIGPGSYCVLHVWPLGHHRSRVDIYEHQQAIFVLLNDQIGNWGMRFNVDGYIALRESEKRKEYAQFFRNGALEVVLKPEYDSNVRQNAQGRIIDGPVLRDRLLRYLNRYIELAKYANIAPPIVIYFTLVNVEGCSLSLGAYSHDPYSIEDIEGFGFDREVILLDSVTIESIDDNIGAVLIPLYEMLWQAVGKRIRPPAKKK